MDKPARPLGPQADDRFALHQRQPRADKLDNRQYRICRADHGYREALRLRVANPDRFDAFMGGIASYIDFDRPCPKCGAVRRRVRDRSCYTCHLHRGRFARKHSQAVAPGVTGNVNQYINAVCADALRHRIVAHARGV